jgi:type II secretion system protein H
LDEVMKLLNQNALKRCIVLSSHRNNAFFDSTIQRSNDSTFCRAFTLIELILVMALLVIVTSLAAPAMANFIRGRAMDSEARRLVALMHAGQSRAVSEGLPMVLWVDEKQGAYGLQAETTGQAGDAKAETLMVDSTLQIAVLNTGLGTPTMFNNLPAIRFLADGTVDENSPQTLQLTDSAGIKRWLIESRNHMGYEISDMQQ